MKIRRTVKLKLNPNEEQRQILLNTMEQYAYAFNYVVDSGFHDRCWNGVELHKRTYYEVKGKCSLPSQLIISARVKAAEAIKAVYKGQRRKKTQPTARRLLAIRYDARSYSVWFDRNEVSIATTEGRQRFGFHVPEFAQQYIDWQICSADLVYQKEAFYICVTFKKEMPETQHTGDCIGVDLGLSQLAVTSKGDFFAGNQTKEVKNRYFRLRKQLQAKGTPSAKRHLKRLSGREKRFQRNMNHIVSKQIVNSCTSGDVIALEDLTHIRERMKIQRRNRRYIHSWAFAELQSFVEYKAAAAGIAVAYITPEYTSQRCSCCGYVSRSNRHGQSFQCKSCGFQLQADLNAARNIQSVYLAGSGISPASGLPVNQPIVAFADAKAPEQLTLL